MAMSSKSTRDYERELQNANAELMGYEFELENKLLALRLSNVQKLINAKEAYEKAGFDKIAKLNLLYTEKDVAMAKKAIKAKMALKLEEQKKANKLDAAAEKRIKATYDAELKAIDTRYEKEKKIAEKIHERALKNIAAENAARAAGELKAGLFGKGKSIGERKQAVYDAFHQNSDGSLNMRAGLATLANALSDLTKQLDNTIENIAGKKGAIDTRLQGWGGKTRAGSYWEAISNDIIGVAGASPLVKQSAIIANIESMVDAGIAYNVEQRAFLQTIKDKIATTFDANNGTLLRLVRIQQQDSTAARLGMESAMNSFLNNMYENTEYLKDVARQVKGSLEEAMALMNYTDAVAFEYQVQKWMGSLYSVGMSSGAVQGIASALGKVAAGDISGLTSSGAGNLLVMAANKASLSLADILAEGLNDSDTNKLLDAMTDYLQQIAAESKNSRVVQQQIASVYGLSASDLRAAQNLTKSRSTIAGSNLSYAGALAQLTSMAGSMYSRTSIGERMTNAWDNLKYSMAGGIASNIPLYALYKGAGLLDAVAGGIALPDIKVMGSGVNLQTTVADLMRVTALSGSILSGIGQMIFNAGAVGGFNPVGMLKALNIPTVTRGGYTTIQGGGVSESGFIGNTSGEDVYAQTMSNANETQRQTLVEAKEEEGQDIQNKVINENVVRIYTLLERLTTGAAAINVITGTDRLNGTYF